MIYFPDVALIKGLSKRPSSYTLLMELKVRMIGNGYGVILPKALMESMAVSEGSLLDAESGDGVTPIDAEFARQVQAFLETEEHHRHSYRDLSQ